METEIQKRTENAARLIIEAVNFANVAGLIASDCGISLSASLYLNVRDAMFHFKALCDCDETDSENVLKHYFCLREHILRGKKDAVIFHVQAVCDAVFEIMQQKEFNGVFSNEEVKQLQRLVHCLKDEVLKLRVEGSNLPKESDYSVCDAWERVGGYTVKIVQICRDRNVPLF